MVEALAVLCCICALLWMSVDLAVLCVWQARSTSLLQYRSETHLYPWSGKIMNNLGLMGCSVTRDLLDDLRMCKTN